MMKNNLFIITLIMCMFFVSLVLSQGIDTKKQNRFDFGHPVNINDLHTDPKEITPGSPSKLNMVIENSAAQIISDIVVQLTLPDEVGFFNDVSRKKITNLVAGESHEINYDILALPNSAEGVYNAELNIEYVNRVGEERQDNNTISIIVKSAPKIYAQVESTEIYTGNKVGDVTIKLVNNNIADIKFLSVEIMESDNYDIISSKREYVGDLDSDDFESVSFRIKGKGFTKNYNIPLELTFKDSLNNDFTQKEEVNLIIRSASDLGIESSNIRNYLIIIVILVIAYFLWRRYKKKKKNNKIKF
jgi:hypothetical protein